MSGCHQRAAERLLRGALRNGGLYVKLGQGLCAFNHLLPPEYGATLRCLEDRALRRGYREVGGDRDGGTGTERSWARGRQRFGLGDGVAPVVGT